MVKSEVQDCLGIGGAGSRRTHFDRRLKISRNVIGKIKNIITTYTS